MQKNEKHSTRQVISTQTKSELEFWRDNLDLKNGYTFKHRPITTKIIFVDASDSGYGGFICQRLGNKICTETFSPFEQSLSSTALELLAINYALKSFHHLLSGECVQRNTDNQNAARILSVGSPKEHLQKIVYEIFQTTLSNDITIIKKWVPREENKIADYYSKLKDSDNWSIDKKTFMLINNKFGPFTIYRFADNKNTKLEKFNSKYYCPGT